MASGTAAGERDAGPPAISMDRMFKPRSIAIVGASARPETYGNMVLRMLRRHRFPGPVYPVNPRYQALEGHPCYPELGAVPGPVDLAYVALPAALGPDVLEQAGRIGVGGAVVPGSGYADGGPEGLLRQQQLVETANRHGIAVCGPNNMGFISYHERAVAWPTHIPEIEPGRVAMISQSGSVGIAISQDGRKLGLGYLVAAGNEAQLSAADYLQYFVRDERIEVVLMFLETLREPEKFAAAAEEARSLGKRLAAVKVGRSASASRMVAAHTGALAGEDAVYSAFLRRHGVLRVDDLDGLVEAGMLLKTETRLPARTRLVPVTLSGGEAALAADLLSEKRVELEDLSERTTKRLKEIWPPFSTPRNPVDAYGLGWDPERFRHIIAALLDDPDIGIVLLCMDSAAGDKADEGYAPQMALACEPLLEGSDKRVVFINNTTANGMGELAREAFEHARIAALMGIREGLSAVAAWCRVASTRAAPEADPRSAAWRGRVAASLDERERIELFREAGVPMAETRAVRSPEEAIGAARELGPIALKGTSAEILHKTEHALVALDLRDEAAIRDAYRGLEERLRAAGARAAEMLVQPMVGRGVELIVGARHVEGFGTVIAVGPGGVLVELIGAASVRLAPVDAQTAREMLDETPAGKLLRGTRGRGPFDLEAACQAIVAFSQLAAASRGLVNALEINPLVVLDAGRGVVGVDAVLER